MTTPQTVPGLNGHLILSADQYTARDRRAWLKARRQGLGASETATILGLNKYQTPLSIWMDKTATEDPEERDAGPKARWGNILEHTVAVQTSKEYLAPLGLKIAPTPGLLAHEEHAWMLATIDRLIVPRASKDRERVESLLEVKTTGEWNYKQNWLDGIPPATYQVQVQQQLAVTGLPYAYVACLVDGYDLKPPVRIDRDEEVIGQLIELGGAWWSQYVEGGQRPPVTFADASLLSTLYPGDASLPHILATDESPVLTALGQFVFHRDQEKAHADAKDRAKFEVQKALGDALAVQDTQGRVLATWKPQTSTGLDTKALKAKHPDLAAEFSKTSTSRTFLVKDLDA